MSAKDAEGRRAEWVASHSGVEWKMARWQVYRSGDLVVHVNGDNVHGRFIAEIAAPGVEEDGARFVLHRLFASVPGAPDRRARPANEPQRPMLERLLAADPGFSTHCWHRGVHA